MSMVRIQFPFSVTWKQHVQADIDGNNQIRYSGPDWVSFFITHELTPEMEYKIFPACQVYGINHETLWAVDF